MTADPQSPFAAASSELRITVGNDSPQNQAITANQCTAAAETQTVKRSPWLARLIIAAGVADVLVTPVLFGADRWLGFRVSDLVGMAWLAAIAGQLAGISAWLCWSRAPLRSRLLRFAGMWFGIVASVMLSMVATSPSRPIGWQDLQFSGIVFYLSSIAIALPLALTRLALRLRIDTPATAADRDAAKQVSIADLLTVTAAVAVLLAMARLLPKPDEPYFWPIALTVMGIISAVSLLSVPVAAWLMSGRYSLPTAIFLTAGYLTVLASSTVLVIGAITGSHPSDSDLAFLLGIFGGYGATLTISLTAARAAGWRLVSGWSRG